MVMMMGCKVDEVCRLNLNCPCMAEKIQQQLKGLGSKLENPPATKDALVKLLKKVNDTDKPPASDDVITYLDLYEDDKEPWNLFGMWSKKDEAEVYFYTRLRKKTENSSRRIERRVGCGTWKGQNTRGVEIYGKDGHGKNCIIGIKKKFSFDVKDKDFIMATVNLKAARGFSYVMHQYSLEESNQGNNLVLCRIKRIKLTELKAQHLLELASTVEEKNHLTKKRHHEFAAIVGETNPPTNNCLSELAPTVEETPSTKKRYIQYCSDQTVVSKELLAQPYAGGFGEEVQECNESDECSVEDWLKIISFDD